MPVSLVWSSDECVEVIGHIVGNAVIWSSDEWGYG